MVRHIALFQFYDNITPDKIDECFEALKGMQGRIPGIVGFEHGTHQSDEVLNDGFIMTFDSRASRDAYLPHPVHQEVKDIVIPCLSRAVVFDFTLP